MKKLILTTAVIVSVFALVATASAATPNSAALRQHRYANRTATCLHVDQNGDGICDNCKQDCVNFVDANGDGICDNCPNGGVPVLDGTGRQLGNRGKCSAN